MQQIAGIDGCKSKWLAIAHVPGSPSFTAQVLATSELPAQPWALAAIDIPIGLPDSGAREADRAARKFIGPRASSVFPCPIRPALDATSWQEACEITYQHSGHRISKQTFAILPKIRAVDRGYFGPEAFASVVAQIGVRSVAADDIVDAFAALWSAERLLAGTAHRLPNVPATDSHGLPVHIWY